MCGIIGLVSKVMGGFDYWSDDLFTDLLKADTIRGPDSTGVFGVAKSGEIDVIKGNTEAYKFIKCRQFANFRKKIYQDYRIVIGHNRKATTGAVSSHNAHPFREKHIVLVHNGTLRSTDELTKDKEIEVVSPVNLAESINC